MGEWDAMTASAEEGSLTAAGRRPESPRSLSRRRADALAKLITGDHGTSTTLSVVIDLDTLHGRSPAISPRPAATSSVATRSTTRPPSASRATQRSAASSRRARVRSSTSDGRHPSSAELNSARWRSATAAALNPGATRTPNGATRTPSSTGFSEAAPISTTSRFAADATTSPRTPATVGARRGDLNSSNRAMT